MRIRNRYGDIVDLEKHRKEIAEEYVLGSPPCLVRDARDVLDALERVLSVKADNAMPSAYFAAIDDVREAAGVVEEPA